MSDARSCVDDVKVNDAIIKSKLDLDLDLDEDEKDVCDSSVNELKCINICYDDDNNNRNTSHGDEDNIMKKKYGGLLKKKPSLISKDHERAFFDSADWALRKQGATDRNKGGPIEELLPKLEPTPHHQLRSKRLAYASSSNDDDFNQENTSDSAKLVEDEYDHIPGKN